MFGTFVIVNFCHDICCEDAQNVYKLETSLRVSKVAGIEGWVDRYSTKLGAASLRSPEHGSIFLLVGINERRFCERSI